MELDRLSQSALSSSLALLPRFTLAAQVHLPSAKVHSCVALAFCTQTRVASSRSSQPQAPTTVSYVHINKSVLFDWQSAASSSVWETATVATQTAVHHNNQ